MMHGDSRVMVVVCLETILPAPCLSTFPKIPRRTFYLGQPSLCTDCSIEEPYHPLCFTDAKITCSSNTHGVAAL